LPILSDRQSRRSRRRFDAPRSEKKEEIARKTTGFFEKRVRAARQNERDVYININDVIIIGKTARKINAFRRRRSDLFPFVAVDLLIPKRGRFANAALPTHFT